jgi:peptidoglycan/LPS O-acetylase OafA/YrhL
MRTSPACSRLFRDNKISTETRNQEVLPHAFLCVTRMRSIPEIEGLRAIAVMVVVLFHAQFKVLPGGYVGVDVFFVISGYLITGLLWREWKTEKSISLLRFFARRILRLAPALAVTSLGIAVVFSLLLPPVVTSNLSSSLIAAQLSFSNFWFYFNTNYFANNSANPALHTWSLAVEEQFYLTLPFLLVIVSRWSDKLTLIVLCLLAGISFAASAWIVNLAPSQAFYFPWLRAWELLVGSVLAMTAGRLRHAGAAHILAITGLFAIAYSCLSFTEKTLFPGVNALLPVFGTAAVILAAGHNNIANRLLGLAPMRWLGKISYSVYLVHWPIVCAVSLTVSLFPSIARILIVAASLVFGWASWKWVESPIRSMAGVWPAKKVVLGFFAFNLLLCLSILGVRSGGQVAWSQFPKASVISNYLAGDPALFKTGTCFLDGSVEVGHVFSQDACLNMKDAQRNALILGDSHAANLWTALTDLHPSINFMHATAVGCRPLLDAIAGAPVCLGLNQFIFQDWLKNAGSRVDLVILAGRWDASEIPAIKHTAAYLKGIGKKVIVIGPTPEYFVTVPLMLAYEDISGLSLEQRMIRRDRIDLDRAIATGLSEAGTTYYSMTGQLCSEQDGSISCTTQISGVPIWSDRDHFTSIGAKFIMSKMPLP